MRRNMRKPNKKLLCNHIRLLRSKRHLTIDELATIAGMDKGSLSKLERGLTSPRFSTLQRVADALGVRVTRLLDAA